MTRTSSLAIVAALGLAAASGAATAAGTAAGAPATAAARTHTVILKEIAFHPAHLTIQRGDSVRWLWRDEAEHNVTFHFSHSRTQQRGSYTLRFNRRGTFNYFCSIHRSEGMTGRIVVR